MQRLKENIGQEQAECEAVFRSVNIWTGFSFCPFIPLVLSGSGSTPSLSPCLCSCVKRLPPSSHSHPRSAFSVCDHKNPHPPMSSTRWLVWVYVGVKVPHAPCRYAQGPKSIYPVYLDVWMRIIVCVTIHNTGYSICMCGLPRHRKSSGVRPPLFRHCDGWSALWRGKSLFCPKLWHVQEGLQPIVCACVCVCARDLMHVCLSACWNKKSHKCPACQDKVNS